MEEKDEFDALREKVSGAYAAGFEANVAGISSTGATSVAESRIYAALEKELGQVVAADVAFHLSDWAADGAFLTLLHLRPEMFTDEEIEIGLRQFLIHAPNHIAAAAKQSGNAIQDIFNVNALDGIHHLD